jgi:microcystin-dependent protein
MANAPVQLASILGTQGAPGPQSPPDPWKQWGDHISYPLGAVIGAPTGDNMGPGSLNAEALYVNGEGIVPIDTGDFIAKDGVGTSSTMDPGATIVLGRDPAADMEAATKSYVDQEVLAIGVPDVAPTPPANPVPGQLWFDPEGLQLYIWYDDGNSAQWVVTINAAPYVPIPPVLNYLPLDGGVLTGPVTGPQADFDAIIGGHVAINCDTNPDGALWGSSNGILRWRMTMVVPASETGAEEGSNLAIDAHNDAGAYLSTPFSINRKTGLTQVTSLKVNGGYLTLDAAATSYKAVAFQSGGKNRWNWGTTDDNDRGAMLFLNAHDDAGGYRSTPISVDRATGHTTLSAASVNAPPTLPTDVTRKQELDELRALILNDLEVASVPIGGVIIWPTNAIPWNYLECNGGVYADTDIPLLAAKIKWLYPGGDATSTAVPNVHDRSVVGAGSSYGLGGTGGVNFVTLGPNEMPVHAHSLYDPAHAHSLADPAHNHGWNDPGHAHGAYQDSHQHGVTITGTFGYGIGTNGAINPFVNQNGSGYATDWRQPGTYTYGAGCGAWNSASGTGQWVYASGTGQTVYNAGGGAAHENRSPFIAMRYVIRYR